MTTPGGGDPYRDQPGPWQPYQHPPVDPRAPIDYPEYPTPPQPYPPPYGYPPPPYHGPVGYGGPSPIYPGHYDPYLGYQATPQQTNGFAVASLITSIAGIVLGIPLAFAYIGLLIPVAGAVLGGVALNQIKRTHQQGRGLAIAGIVIGSLTAVGLLFVVAVVTLTAAALHSRMLMWR